MKNIAVITSGGDAPGMNAALRAVVRKAVYNNYDVYAFERGYQGILEKEFQKMNSRSVSDILQRGGTILKSARCLEFKKIEARREAKKTLDTLEIDTLVVIGGDGSFKGALQLEKLGVKTICIPGTIDNDLGYTDYTIGFDTAITTVIEAVSKLRDTSSSHNRVFVVEVMGRNCGDIALYAGLSSGAENIIVPEVKYDINEIIQSVKRGMLSGKSHNIILVAEDVLDVFELSRKIEKETDISSRVAVIGHLQRGGSPTAFDRILATRMGSYAIDLIKDNKSGLAVGIKGNDIIGIDIDKALNKKDIIDKNMYELFKILAK